MTTAPACQAAIHALLGRCDGASTQDGQGFSRFDVAFARSLGETPHERWSQNMTRAAWWMLRKYRVQLRGFGIDYDQIPKPPDAEPENREAFQNAHAGSEAAKACGARIVDLEGDAFIFRFPFDMVTIAAVKEVPGRRFVPGQSGGTASVWKAPAQPPAVDPVRALLADGFEAGAGVAEALGRLEAERDGTIAASRAGAGDLHVEGLRGTLRPFQRAGVAYALKARRCIIGDEMGLGKTVQALAVVQAAGAFPALVICPATLKYNWLREAKAWLPTGRFPMVADVDHPGTFGTDLTIINYDALALHEKGCRFGEKPKRAKNQPAQKDPNPACGRACRLMLRLAERGYLALIMDEAHYLKNYQAKRTAAVKWLARRIDYRLALTGTPLLNRPQELISPLGILGTLDKMGGFWHFAERYCAAERTQFGWDMKGAANLDELNTRLRSTCYVRRRKADVLTELPPKTRTRVEVDIDNRAEYAEAERNLIAWSAERAIEDKAFLASIVALDPAGQAKAIEKRWESQAEKVRRAEQLVRVTSLQTLAGRGKLAAVTEWVESFLESGEKLVLFAHHIETQRALVDAFPGAARVMAEDGPEERDVQVRRFQESEDCRLIVCSLKAGGVGITLTAASNVALVEFGWTPADHDQAEDRCHRIGQHDNVTAWYLVARDTVENEQLDLIDEKRVVVDAATDGAEKPAADPVSDFMARIAGRATA